MIILHFYTVNVKVLSYPVFVTLYRHSTQYSVESNHVLLPAEVRCFEEHTLTSFIKEQ